MALPWHIPLEAAPPFREPRGAPKPSLLKHYCSLNVNENPCEEVQTGLMCEIGTGNREPATIQRLISAGMTVARLNLRDLEPDASSQLIQSVRQAVYNYSAELEYVYPLAVMVDVKGPDIVTGELKTGPNTTIELTENSTIRLTTDAIWRECGTAECIYVGYDHLTDLNPDDIIFIDSLTPGFIKLIVSKIGDDSIECKVCTGGIIGSQMTVRINRVPQEISYSIDQSRGDNKDSRKDSKDSLSCSSLSKDPFEHVGQQLSWAVGADVDAVLVAKAQILNDIRSVKDILSEKGRHILIFASIETALGLENIDILLDIADGIYLDRCILSTDLPVEKIFVASKKIIAKCNEIGKPCIVKSIINEKIPTMCVTDIANLVIDGVDVIALELHYDSPWKKLPLTYDAVRTAEQCLAATSVICRQAENIIWQPHIYGNMELMQSPLDIPTKALCVTAVELAMRSQSVVIICLTTSGRSAKILSHVRPTCPIIAVTRACHTARQLRYWRGVRAVHYFEVAKPGWAAEVDARIKAALDYCKAKRIVRAGDPYVTVTGTRPGMGYCDSVRLLYASARDTILLG